MACNPLKTMDSNENSATSDNPLIPQQAKGFVGGIRRVMPTINDLTMVGSFNRASRCGEQGELHPVATTQTFDLLQPQVSSRQAEVEEGLDLFRQVSNFNKSSSHFQHEAVPSCGKFTQTALRAQTALKAKLSLLSK